jgi:hypothetical protein
MFAPDAKRNREIRKALLFVWAPMTILVWSVPARMQAPSSDTRNYVFMAQEFLHSTYPQLNDRHLTITIVGTYAFDLPAEPVRRFSLYVGEGQKDRILGYVGGLAKNSRPQDLGPIHPKQYLSTGFTFGENGLLLFFGAEGDAVRDPALVAAFGQAWQAHPEWTEQQVTSALKQYGAKYGPANREELLKNLPVDLLERYLGKLTIQSAEFKGFEPKAPLHWMVKMVAKDVRGVQTNYTLLIDPFKGSLTNLASDTKQTFAGAQ